MVSSTKRNPRKVSCRARRVWEGNEQEKASSLACWVWRALNGNDATKRVNPLVVVPGVVDIREKRNK
jgi:hypothetical protein